MHLTAALLSLGRASRNACCLLIAVTAGYKTGMFVLSMKHVLLFVKSLCRSSLVLDLTNSVVGDAFSNKFFYCPDLNRAWLIYELMFCTTQSHRHFRRHEKTSLQSAD